MKHVTILIALLCGHAAAQNNQTNDGIIKNDGKTLYILTMNNGEEIKTSDLVLGPSETLKLDILTKNEIKQNYKDVKADVVIRIVPKSGVIFLNLKQVLDKFNIGQQYRNYKVLVEGVFEVNDTSQLLISGTLLETVTVDKDKKYLNIITKQYKNTLEYLKKAKLDKNMRIKAYHDRNNR
jgi:hypothetical protein